MRLLRGEFAPILSERKIAWAYQDANNKFPNQLIGDSKISLAPVSVMLYLTVGFQ